MDQELKNILKTLATKQDILIIQSDIRELKQQMVDLEVRLKAYTDKQIERLARMIAQSFKAEREYVDGRFAQLEKTRSY